MTKPKKTQSNQHKMQRAGKAATRAGSNAGRGFRYQDAVSAWLAVEIWAGRRAPATMIPEGGDDVELRGEETTFVQVKSRREHLGNYTTSETANYIKELWNRSLNSSPQPKHLELILERNVIGLTSSKEQCTKCAVKGPLATKLLNSSESCNLLLHTTITLSTSPQELAISLITGRLKCSPIAAQMCFAELLILVGDLADANGRLMPDAYLGLSISDTDVSLHNILAAVDIDAIESALRKGICEPVDFLTPLNDPNFYLGVDVEPGHVAAGLVAERPQSRASLIQGIEERRAALIVGASGAGKSALMWETANTLRHTVRWFRIRHLNTTDIPAIRQLVRTFRASEDSPLGLVMDDVGRNNPESWGYLLKEALSVPGVVLLGSIREEDVTLIAERARVSEIRVDPDYELAERLWHELQLIKKTEWKGWREPWKLSGGLLLEYVHILTHGQRMEKLLADQVAARISARERTLELDILRVSAWAGSANAQIDVSRLSGILSVGEADLNRALQRLIQEHLIQTPSPGKLAGLHQLRSKKLLLLTHQTPLPTMEVSFGRTVACVPACDLEMLVAETLSVQSLPLSTVLRVLAIHFEHNPDALAIASALRGLGTGRISTGVDEWLKTPEACALQPTQLSLAARFGLTDVALDSLGILSGLQAAANKFRQIKGALKDDPRRLVIEQIPSSSLSILISSANPESLDEILSALIGLPISPRVSSALLRSPSNFLNMDINLAKSIMGSLAALDRDIAIQWAAEIGQDNLFKKIQNETAWAGPVSIQNLDEKINVCCDLWYVASSIQKQPQKDVVDLCELLLALCPSADIARSNAITVSGQLAGIAKHPLATKQIPRENLPASSITEWNRRWINIVSRKIASPNYSDYLARGLTILETLVPTLERVFDTHLRGKTPPADLFETLNSLNTECEELTPPETSLLETSGIKSEGINTTVTKFQNLLQNTSITLIRKFAELPDHAGAFIAWLNNLISTIDIVATEEPWQLITGSPSPALAKLKNILEALRQLAGEAHERQESPMSTWMHRSKRVRKGNALHFVSCLARTTTEKRLARRKDQIELSAKNAGINASFYLNINPKGILPWPPVDVLALLPATDIATLIFNFEHQLNLLRSLIDSSIHLTVIPSIDGVAFPIFATSGHQALFSDVEGARIWAENLGLPQAPSTITNQFGEVWTLAGELGAIERLGLGTKRRPVAEAIVRQNLEFTFAEKQKKLLSQLDSFDLDIQMDVSTVIEYLRSGDIDTISEAQATLDGASTEVMEAVGAVTLLLAEHEWLATQPSINISE